MSKLTLITGDIVYIDFDAKGCKYLVDCALAGNAGCRVAYKDEAKTQEIIINLNAVVMIEEL